jgi:hypothetical protein
MKKIRITLTMTEQEAEWLEQACFVEEDYPHSKFLNHVSNVARRARHAFQQSVQRTAGTVSLEKVANRLEALDRRVSATTRRR